MKIAMVIPTLEIAGAEVMCKNLTLELHKRKLDVIVISLYKRTTIITEELEKNGIRIIFLDKKPGLDLKIIGALKSIFNEEKPDVVHTHLDCLKYSATAAKLSGIFHCVHTVHNVAEKEADGVAKIINRYIFQKQKALPVALSQEVQKSIIEVYKLQKDKIPIIYNGVDLSRCIPKESYAGGDKITFMHVGRFSRQKNHEMLIEAFCDFAKEYKNVELLLVGKGELFHRMQEFAKTCAISDKIAFLGERNDVFEILHRADVFLLPSLYEGMPMSIIEAMGTGLPVIATRTGGIPTMIQDKETGCLIDCNKDELVNAMKEMVNEKTRERYGKKALIFANKNFSVSVMADQYCKVYEIK